jgi:hypothetical protein
MEATEIKTIEAALAVIKDSELLLVKLRFSTTSRSLGCDHRFSGIDPFLKAAKRKLWAQLCKAAVGAFWHWIGRKIGYTA